MSWRRVRLGFVMPRERGLGVRELAALGLRGLAALGLRRWNALGLAVPCLAWPCVRRAPRAGLRSGSGTGASSSTSCTRADGWPG
jgi:hypothetical protein